MTPYTSEAVLDPGNTARDVWANKGCIDQQRAVRLTGKGWCPHIQRKAQKDERLSACQEGRNRRIAKTRARIEHVFGPLKQQGSKVLRSISLARATLHLHCKVACYNLHRLYTLKTSGVMAF